MRTFRYCFIGASLIGSVARGQAQPATGHEHPRSASAPHLVAEIPLATPEQSKHGVAFLPVTMYGHRVTMAVDFIQDHDLTVSTAALARLNVSPFQTTHLDSLQIGSDLYQNLPLDVIDDPDWTMDAPPGLPPVVGIMSGRFLAARYDLVYDSPGQRVQLYAFPAKEGKRSEAWLPPKFVAGDCGRMIEVPAIAGAFTGMDLQIDGHHVTGVLEMFRFGGEHYHDEKMNAGAFAALGLPSQSPRIGPMRDSPGEFNGAVAKDEVSDVQVRIGKRTLFTGPLKVFPNLEVDSGLPEGTPVVLLNLVTIRHLVLFNGISSGRVCLRTP